MMRSAKIVAVLGVIASALIADAPAQSAIKLVGRRYSDVELVYGNRSVIFDLDEALTGPNGSLPGSSPHKYRVLFTAEKEGTLYLVANVQSASQITKPMMPCAGDSPQSLLWIKADRSLERREVRSEIYASCGYNYNNSKIRRDKTGITIRMGDGRGIELRYDNTYPEKGLVITKSFN
jgi:hypothetical protein